ncbi:hypothetical protein G6F56_013778 [Rhizopus delemar]|nr:hypothetical protein G6F56_013778 [Rhizopus delemar]
MHRGKGTFDAYPNAEVLLEKAYASDEEDLYSSAVHRAAREELSVLEPGRTEEFTPEEVRGALMNKPLAGFIPEIPR